MDFLRHCIDDFVPIFSVSSSDEVRRRAFGRKALYPTPTSCLRTNFAHTPKSTTLSHRHLRTTIPHNSRTFFLSLFFFPSASHCTLDNHRDDPFFFCFIPRRGENRRVHKKIRKKAKHYPRPMAFFGMERQVLHTPRYAAYK